MGSIVYATGRLQLATAVVVVVVVVVVAALLLLRSSRVWRRTVFIPAATCVAAWAGLGEELRIRVRIPVPSAGR